MSKLRRAYQRSSVDGVEATPGDDDDPIAERERKERERWEKYVEEWDQAEAEDEYQLTPTEDDGSVESLLTDQVLCASSQAIAMASAAKVGLNATTGSEAIAAMREMAQILDGVPFCEDVVSSLWMWLSVATEDTAREHCHRMATQLANSAEQANQIGALLNDELRGIIAPGS